MLLGWNIESKKVVIWKSGQECRLAGVTCAVRMKECHAAARERLVHIIFEGLLLFDIHFIFQSPSTIGEERQYNPFLRSHSAELHLALGLQQFQDEDWTQFRARVLEELRKRKDLYNRR